MCEGETNEVTRPKKGKGKPKSALDGVHSVGKKKGGDGNPKKKNQPSSESCRGVGLRKKRGLEGRPRFHGRMRKINGQEGGGERLLEGLVASKDSLRWAPGRWCGRWNQERTL